MLIKRAPLDTPVKSSEITPRAAYENRRTFIKQAMLGGLTGAGLASWPQGNSMAQGQRGPRLAAKTNPAYATVERQTTYADATTYNNFYEFGTEKDDPARNAHTLRPRPWTINVGGAVKTPRTFGIEELLKLAPMEERVYRLRCVEGWSMVIPWIGFSLAELLKRVEPTSNARFVEFLTLADPKQMPGLRSPVLEWPYREGLRMDEAMHPLTLLTFGMYGEILPNQNGAPIRLNVPWKYGFKSIKSIVAINLVREMPVISWTKSAPQEYGFYSNVNPTVDHPRWSQATERRIGEDAGGFSALFAPKRKTLMFNGYENQVARLYAGMDLKKLF